jgi:hypothetical protein
LVGPVLDGRTEDACFGSGASTATGMFGNLRSIFFLRCLMSFLGAFGHSGIFAGICRLVLVTCVVSACFVNAIRPGNPSAISSLRRRSISPSDCWFFALYPEPDIRWNFGLAETGQTRRLFLPLDARIGHQFTKALTASLEVGVPIINQYPVYDFKTELRVDMKF